MSAFSSILDITSRKAGDEQVTELWETLTCIPGLGVTVVDITGRIVYCNRRACELHLPMEPDQAVGLRLHELGPADFARDRMEVVTRVLETRTPMASRYIRRGRCVESIFRPLTCGQGETPLGVSLAMTGGFVSCETLGIEIRESTVAEFGDLDVLTPREIEVFALIGRGLTNEAIGGLLYRSTKTIDNHHQAIRRKLGMKSRVEIALMARTSGLEPRHASLRRFRFDGVGRVVQPVEQDQAPAEG